MALAQHQAVPEELQDFEDVGEVVVLLVGAAFFRRLAAAAAIEGRRPGELLELVLEEHLRKSFPGLEGKSE